MERTRERRQLHPLDIDNDGWEAVFGKVDTGADKSAAVKVAVASVATRTRPWCG